MARLSWLWERRTPTSVALACSMLSKPVTTGHLPGPCLHSCCMLHAAGGVAQMTLLVTGGGGFIGSHLVGQLVERGERVRVLERPGATISHLPLERIDVVFADIRDRTAVARALGGCEEVYHLAANPNLWTQQRGHFRQ